MRRGARGRRARAAALLTATVTTALVAGCTGGSGPGDDGRGAPKDSKYGTSPSALVVKIDNAAAARPHTGVDAADVVYAEQVEGGLSRLIAVYATRLPKTIGPVRSARESDLELLRQFDRPTLAFSGAQKKLLPLIDKAPLKAETPGNAADAYFRGPGRPAPHNLYLTPGRIVPETPGEAALTTGFHYGAAPAGGMATASRTVRYPAASFSFTWSDARDRWLVGMDGTPATTADGERMTTGTVVVQYVKVRASAFRDFLGNNTPYTETVGSGKAQVLRDGRAWDVDWKREKATDGTSFTTGDGTPVNFAEGQVWVVFAEAP
ncbi:DUF3048 domain-containing protein [Streptomyces sp. NPDC047880]|uniref:DUF3048 domain-containing protein n=1 Tax=Streptomyces sp. NPDC047880 TaxID=3155626 RepID=UPI0034566769